jgi:hypothetical protein
MTRCRKIQRDKSKRVLRDRTSKSRRKERISFSNSASGPHWEMWPLALVAGDSKKDLAMGFAGDCA